MRRINRVIGILVVSLFATLSVYSQQPTKDKDPAKTQTTTQDYVFPTSHERFKRYVKSTIGPLALARTAASAGIAQWRDSPEEWGQGAKGYGRRFASRVGQDA